MTRRYAVTLQTRARGFARRWSCTIRATHPRLDVITEIGVGRTAAEAFGDARQTLRWKRAARRRAEQGRRAS